MVMSIEQKRGHAVAGSARQWRQISGCKVVFHMQPGQNLKHHCWEGIKYTEFLVFTNEARKYTIFQYNTESSTIHGNRGKLPILDLKKYLHKSETCRQS